jgi:hypothetical protein
VDKELEGKGKETVSENKNNPTGAETYVTLMFLNEVFSGRRQSGKAKTSKARPGCAPAGSRLAYFLFKNWRYI